MAWAVRLPRGSGAALGALRLIPDLRVLEEGDQLWLRGDEADDALELELRKLPGALRYDVIDGNQLVRWDRRLPEATLPTGTWRRLRENTSVAFPPAAFPGKVPGACRVRVARGGAIRPAGLLRITTAALAAYAVAAPEIRLRPLRMATRGGEALVMGEPLPPVAGEPFVVDDGIAVPCGCEWQPRVDASILRDLLGLEAGDVALLHMERPCEIVRAEFWAPLCREVARAAAGGDGHAG